MKHLIPLCTAALIAATSAPAAPLCDAFASAETMPSKYRKLAPVLSDGPADWIITADQMKTDYAPDAEAAALLAHIAAAFEARGTRLAIVMAPPRPVVAGQDKLDALAGGDAGYDVAAVTASFGQMIDTVRSAGIIAPDLAKVATGDAALRASYYYPHDTHWTPQGAAFSAVALAQEVLAAGLPAFAGSTLTLPDPAGPEAHAEKGSLAQMARAVCGAEIAKVTHQIPVFAKGDLGLLDDTGARPRILLAGSSFSNRYQNDAYRVAEAISGALGADVVNHSVSGGGAIGALEGVIASGLLDAEAPFDLVVWELPYTQGLRSVGMLRQLLGALEFSRDRAVHAAAQADGSGKVKVALKGADARLLAFEAPSAQLTRMKVDLRFVDGSKTTLSLARSAHVPAGLRSDWWAVSLAGIAPGTLSSATFRYDADAVQAGSAIRVY